GLD
ncbi:hypothetical protein MIMGU_mgv1a0034082mg, partial [Erythranthe guttata]